MRFYIFKSDTVSGLRAFAGDLTGANLPSQFSPWHVTGVVGPDQGPPHNLSRDTIKKAIDDQGFQLWRLKPKKAKS